MHSRFLLLGVLLLGLSSPVFALISRLTALADILSESTFIVLARVDSLDSKRPAMVLSLREPLKGKPAWSKLSVLLQGDARATRLKEQPQLLRRLQPGLPLVLFISQAERDQVAFAFSNGTWFSLTGTTVDGEVRWAFTHLEPYLRRTFKGSTQEMLQVVRDALANKRKPPAPDPKEKPGLGPEVSSSKSGALKVSAAPVRAVIPTVLVGGPLALLAMLFPTVFAGRKRWLALLSTCGLICTLVALHWWASDRLVGSWWGTPTALWKILNLVILLGLGWAWHRHLKQVQRGEAPLVPGWGERSVLLGLSLLGLAILVFCRYRDQSVLSPLWLPVSVLIFSFWFGGVYVVWIWLRGPRLVPALASETVILTGLAIFSALLSPALTPPLPLASSRDQSATASSTRVRLVWSFLLPEKGALASSPVVVGNRVLIAAALDSVFRPYGALYCLDRETGTLLWTFHDDRRMKQVFSSPVVVDDKIYIGEGFHQDYECKVYCLDLLQGKKRWEFVTGSHTESTPAVIQGRLYIGAGEDGLYCLSADRGEKQWHFPGFHIDASPLVRDGRLYVGSGMGEAFQTTALFCLDARSGQPIWRVPTRLPVWSRPVVSQECVYVATGNGRLNQGAEHPQGEIYCLRQQDGSEVWKKKFPDGILAAMASDPERLFACCRDGCLYALRLKDGEPLWHRDLGSPLVSAPVLQTCHAGETSDRRLYVGSSAGVLACLQAETGEILWTKDLVQRSQVPLEWISTLALDLQQGKRRLYVAITMLSTARTGEVSCYEEQTE